MEPLDYPWTEPPETGRTLEIAPGVRWLRMPMPGSLNHINLYLLRGDDGWTIVDTGLGDDATREAWEQIFAHELGGLPVTRILVTHMHPDHVGQAGWLSDRWQAPLYMTRAEYYQARTFSGSGPTSSSWEAERFYLAAGLTDAELEAMRVRQSQGGGYGAMITPLPMGYRRLQEGDTLTLAGHDWRVVVGAGHSPEHACLYCRALGIMIAGDQVLPIITSNVSVHPTEPEANPLKDWMESHDRLLALPDETLVLPAHKPALPRPAQAPARPHRPSRGPHALSGGALRDAGHGTRPAARAVPARTRRAPADDGARRGHRPSAPAHASRPHRAAARRRRRLALPLDRPGPRAPAPRRTRRAGRGPDAGLAATAHTSKRNTSPSRFTWPAVGVAKCVPITSTGASASSPSVDSRVVRAATGSQSALLPQSGRASWQG